MDIFQQFLDDAMFDECGDVEREVMLEVFDQERHVVETEYNERRARRIGFVDGDRIA